MEKFRAPKGGWDEKQWEFQGDSRVRGTMFSLG
jgi:hypothetical protein